MTCVVEIALIKWILIYIGRTASNERITDHELHRYGRKCLWLIAMLIPRYFPRGSREKNETPTWLGDLQTENYSQEISINCVLQMEELCGLYEIWGLHRDENLDCGFLGYGVKLSSLWLTTFLRNRLPPLLGTFTLKTEAASFYRTSVNTYHILKGQMRNYKCLAGSENFIIFQCGNEYL
jgi:hypothetical protein